MDMLYFEEMNECELGIGQKIIDQIGELVKLLLIIL